MQYNMLADRLAHPHRYAYVPLDILSFSYRSARILEEIRTSDCDVLCLQEMDHAQDVYLPALDKMSYKTLYYQKKPFNNV
jgi:CCR4-NOT transcription complex subunit 6